MRCIHELDFKAIDKRYNRGRICVRFPTTTRTSIQEQDERRMSAIPPSIFESNYSTHRKGVRDLDLDRYLGEESLQNCKKIVKQAPMCISATNGFPKTNAAN